MNEITAEQRILTFLLTMEEKINLKKYQEAITFGEFIEVELKYDVFNDLKEELMATDDGREVYYRLYDGLSLAYLKLAEENELSLDYLSKAISLSKKAMEVNKEQPSSYANIGKCYEYISKLPDHENTNYFEDLSKSYFAKEKFLSNKQNESYETNKIIKVSEEQKFQLFTLAMSELMETGDGRYETEEKILTFGLEALKMLESTDNNLNSLGLKLMATDDGKETCYRLYTGLSSAYLKLAKKVEDRRAIDYLNKAISFGKKALEINKEQLEPNYMIGEGYKFLSDFEQYKSAKANYFKNLSEKYLDTFHKDDYKYLTNEDVNIVDDFYMDIKDEDLPF